VSDDRIAKADRPALTLRQLNRTTLLRHSLLARATDSPAAAIARLAGLQAQYSYSPYIALWSRLADFSIGDLERALDEHAVVKASLMRATLHLVAAEDFPAFSVAISVPWIAVWQASAGRAGMDTSDLHRRVLAYAAEPRTVAEMEAFLAKIVPDSALGGRVPDAIRHVPFQMVAAHGWLVHVPPSGHWGSFARARYIDAGVWLPGATPPEPDDAVVTTVERYLSAYGPASEADIAKWAYQRKPVVRAALSTLGDRIVRLRSEGGRELVDLVGAPLADGDEPAPGRFLAKWDSVLIGYAKRDRMLPDGLASIVVKRNGDILPSFTVDGFVAGTWSHATSKTGVVLEIAPEVKVPASARAELTEEAERLVRFVAPEATRHEVRWRG
jgi:hypothetical protein